MDVFKIIEVAPHPAFVTDREDRIVALNSAAVEFLGTSRKEVVGRAFHEVTEPRDVFGNRLSAHGRSLQDMVRRGEPIQAYDLDVRQASGRFVRAGLSLMVAFGPEPGHYHLVYHLGPSAAPPPIRRRHRSTAQEPCRLVGLGRSDHGATKRQWRRNAEAHPP